MKRGFILSLVLVLFLASSGGASSWNWWAPSPPSGGGSTWGQILWPELNQPSWPAPQPPAPSPGTPPVKPEMPEKPTEPTLPPNSSLTADEQQIINQVNEERAKNGLNVLQLDTGLIALAKKKSQDMAVNNYFDHVSPTYGTVYTMLNSAGISYSRAGENIAVTGSIARVHPLFMGSVGHRVNILHSGYTHLGVGIVKRGVTYYVTQIFIKR